MEQQQLEMAQSAADNSAAAAGAGLIVGIIYLGIFALMFASLWKIFSKAGEPGWAALVPFYNLAVGAKVAGKPAWWMVLLLIPGVNFVIQILWAVGLAKNFGKGTGFALGLVFLGPIFMAILAFGDAQYVGEGAGEAQSQPMRRAA